MTPKLSRDVFLIGAAMTHMKFRHLDKTYMGLAQDAAWELLQHMGPNFHMGMPTFVNTSTYNDGFAGLWIGFSQFPAVIGTHLAEMDRSEAGGQTGFAGMARTIDAIASGRHDMAVQLGIEKSTDCFDPFSGTQTPAVVHNIAQSWHPWLQLDTGIHAASSYWQRTRAFDYANPGFLDEDALAALGEYICKNGLSNPKAQRFPEVVTAEWIKASRPIIGGMRLGHSCMYSEGGVATSWGTEEVARYWSKKNGISKILI